MTKLREITPADIAKHYKQVQEVFALLDAKDVNQSDSGFSADKDAIVRVFNGTNGCDKADLLVRLTLIDSMYSTQMSRRYYALDELAEALRIAAKYDRKVLVEQGVTVREIEVSVMGNEQPMVSQPGEICSSNEFYD